MSQKANILTLRYPNKSLNIDIQNAKKNLQTYKLMNVLKQSLDKKGIILAYYSIKSNNTNYLMKMKVFFGTSKLLRYKNYIKSKSSTNNLTRINLFKKLVEKTLKYKSINLKIVVLNHMLDKTQTKKYFTIFKKFKGILFSRQFSLFIDFIKLTYLFITKKIQVESYIQILGKIFKILPKNKHSRYLIFIHHLFKLIIDNSKGSINGLKLELSGKLKGKLRSSTEQIKEGNISNPSISKEISYSMTHIYTIYGAFGIKLWVSYSN